tara:strand:- start:180 stop:464 length:285 start_codon:yes stop_codon:yes gene_type:complete
MRRGLFRETLRPLYEAKLITYFNKLMVRKYILVRLISMNKTKIVNCKVPALAVPSFEEKFPNWSGIDDKDFMLAVKSIFTDAEFSLLKKHLKSK